MSYKFQAECCINHGLIISLEYAFHNVWVVLAESLIKELSYKEKIQLWDSLSLATCFSCLVASFYMYFPFFLTAVSFFLFTFSFLSTFFLISSYVLIYPFPFRIAHTFFVLHLVFFEDVQEIKTFEIRVSRGKTLRHNSLVTSHGSEWP